MSSMIDMSLEDIIRKKREINKSKGRDGPPSQPKGKAKGKNPPPAKKLPITDARNKIISKKRNQFTDARDKLAQLAKQKDARLKLEALRKKRALLQAPAQGGRQFLQTRGGKIIRNPQRKEIVFGDRSRQVVSQPLSHSRRNPMPFQAPPPRSQPKPHINTKRFLESRYIGERSGMYMDKPRQRLKPILRTVDNDLEMIDDPMGEDYVAPRPTMSNRIANLQLRIVAHNTDAREGRNAFSHRLATPEKEKSPPRPPSILKKRPMAALRTEKKVDKAEKPVEYRIIVSNLRNTVTGGDIEELFGDVGGMLESRLVRPGTAEVIYKTMEDAQKAVELYHNRQLDGQPMNCLLVTPRSSASAANVRNGSKPVLYSTNSNVEPDISTFHKVLFSHF